VLKIHQENEILKENEGIRREVQLFAAGVATAFLTELSPLALYALQRLSRQEQKLYIQKLADFRRALYTEGFTAAQPQIKNIAAWWRFNLRQLISMLATTFRGSVVLHPGFFQTGLLPLDKKIPHLGSFIKGRDTLKEKQLVEKTKSLGF